MPRCTSLRAAGTLYVPFQPTSGFSKRQVQRQWVVTMAHRPSVVCLHGRSPVFSPSRPGFRRELRVTSPSR